MDPSSISSLQSLCEGAWQQTHRRPDTRMKSGRVAWACDKEREVNDQWGAERREREKESGQEVCRNKPGTRRRLNDAHTAVWVVKRLQESKEERERERERESQRSNGHSSKMCTVKITVIHSSVFVIKPYVFIHEHVICIWIPYLDNFLPVVSILLCSFCLH